MAILTSTHDLLIAMATVNASVKLYKTKEQELHNQTVLLLNGPQPTLPVSGSRFPSC